VEGLPPEVKDWLSSAGKGKLRSISPLGGGCIHQARILHSSTGDSFFLKSNQSAPVDMFLREAESLRSLKVKDGPAIPKVLLVGENFLLLEDLSPAPRRDDFWELYGRQLASLHQQKNQRFGFSHDNYLGLSVQHNGWMEDGIEFFRQRRLIPQIRQAVDQGILTEDDLRRSTALLNKLDDLLLQEPAVLLHGDLWSGNLISNSRGYPALIDPAVYFGWAETDLAMAELFGSYPQEFYASYLEVNPLSSGFRERYPLYNLYHLLNHLNLFGGQYLPGVREILRRFS